MRRCRQFRLVGIAFVSLGLTQAPVRAEGSSTKADNDSIAIGGPVSNSTITNTVNKQDPAVLAAMVKTFTDQMAATEDARAKAEAHATEFGLKWGFTSSAVAEFFRILGKQNVPDEKVPAQLIEIATHFAQAQSELATLQPDEPKATELAKGAQQALNEGRFSESDALLDQAKDLELAAYRQARQLKEKAQEAENRHALKAANVDSRQGSIALTQLRYSQAAKHFGEASSLLPKDAMYYGQRTLYLRMEASALCSQGSELGDNAALASAIGIYRSILSVAPHESKLDSDDWAEIQDELGIALQALGERESGTATLKEAVMAERAALKEWRRDSDPLTWAHAESDLAHALESLGERESGTVGLEEAVGDYQAALKEQTRDADPLGWATTQNNLGNTLTTIGLRETGTTALEKAVAAFRAALEVWTRDRQPFSWAIAQNNLGVALEDLGEIQNDTAKLADAIVAYSAALEVWTRDRAPLDWAIAESNVGYALAVLGQLESSMAKLEEAVGDYRAALEERTRERVPLGWADTQDNLGVTLAALGERESGAAKLEDAVTALRGALEERTRERTPFDWAETQSHLAAALAALGERESNSAKLEEAVGDYQAALEELTESASPRLHQIAQQGLAKTLAELRHHRTQ